MVIFEIYHKSKPFVFFQKQDLHCCRLYASKDRLNDLWLWQEKKRTIQKKLVNALWVELMVHEAYLFSPQLFSVLVWCWETDMQSLWIPWEGEKRERSYTGVCHQWGFGDCQIQCLALSFIVLCENQRLPGHQCVINLFAIHAAAKCSTL